MTAKSPAFQFYPKDWLSSLKILMMTPEQEGAYIRLLAYCWDSGDCSLPDDDHQLAAMSRLGEGWFKGGSTTLRKCFVPHPSKPGSLTNERLLQERSSQEKWRQKSSEGGKRSAQQRAEKQASFKGGSRVVQPKPNRPVQPTGNSSSASASSKLGVSLSAYTPAFEEFWAAYPRRDGSKFDAFKAYQQSIDGGTDHGRILESVRQFAAHVQRSGTEKSKVAHASTWLNGRRWESDYSPDPAARAPAAGGKPSWSSEADRLAAKYAAEAQRERQAPAEHRPGESLRLAEAVREDLPGA
jgi:uncharacterized protein YdaU (DUF1376 family)